MAKLWDVLDEAGNKTGRVIQRGGFQESRGCLQRRGLLETGNGRN